jgi:hypothetical protein
MVSYIKRRDPNCTLKLEGCTGKSQTADHIKPVEDGGTNLPNNLQGACHACNWKRGKKSLAELGLEGPQEATGADLSASAPGGTQILMDGSEKPSHRVLLESMGVTRFAFSFWRVWSAGRLPKTKRYQISEYFSEDAEVYVDSGWLQAQEKLPAGDLPGYVEAYDEFLEANLWRLSGATEMHLQTLGMPWISEWREKHADDMGLSLFPVWLPEHGQPMLFTMAEQFENVAIPNKAMEDPIIQTRLGALHRQFQTSFHALNVANPDTLRNVPLETTSTISWASPQMRGETIVWDGSRLVRYQAKQKTQARMRYKAVVEKAGLDHEKILADDANEVTRLAIWSYMQLEKSMSDKKPFQILDGGLSANKSGNQPSGDNAEQDGGHVDSKALEVRNEQLTVAPRTLKRRDPQARMNLPVLGVEVREESEMVDGHPTLRDTPVLKSNHGSLRQCNTCVISANCPAFTPDSECAFSLPVEIGTKLQLKALLNSIIEIQGQRVAFARFAEELNGGYPDPNLSQEIDRLFKLVKNMKELESNNEFVRLTVERQQSGGVLSAIFGERAQRATELPNPVDSDTLIGQVLGPDSY